MVGLPVHHVHRLEVTIKVIPGDRVELCADLVRGETATWPVTPVTPA